MNKFLGLDLDFFGFVASFLCAVHCAATPLLLMFGTLGSFAWITSHSVEAVFIVCSLLLVYYSLWRSYHAIHRQPKALQLAAIGIVLIIVGHLLPHHLGEYVLALAGLCIATSHYINWMLVRLDRNA